MHRKNAFLKKKVFFFSSIMYLYTWLYRKKYIHFLKITTEIRPVRKVFIKKMYLAKKNPSWYWSSHEEDDEGHNLKLTRALWLEIIGHAFYKIFLEPFLFYCAKIFNGFYFVQFFSVLS